MRPQVPQLPSSCVYLGVDNGTLYWLLRQPFNLPITRARVRRARPERAAARALGGAWLSSTGWDVPHRSPPAALATAVTRVAESETPPHARRPRRAIRRHDHEQRARSSCASIVTGRPRTPPFESRASAPDPASRRQRGAVFQRGPGTKASPVRRALSGKHTSKKRRPAARPVALHVSAISASST